MQGDEAVDIAAEGCVLAAAERHMAEGEPRDGGKCWECVSFCEAQASELLPRGLRQQLVFCGLCDHWHDMTIVDRSEWHSANECWEEDR